MGNFKLSQRSLDRIDGIDEELYTLVRTAIHNTPYDFGIPNLGGLRTIEEQRALVDSGASKTMKSKHLLGHAVDLMAYCKGARWELNLYDEIADAISESAKFENVKVRWGAAWTIDSIGDWNGTAQQAMESYIDTRRSQNRRPFIDAPHFELML